MQTAMGEQLSLLTVQDGQIETEEEISFKSAKIKSSQTHTQEPMRKYIFLNVAGNAN